MNWHIGEIREAGMYANGRFLHRYRSAHELGGSDRPEGAILRALARYPLDFAGNLCNRWQPTFKRG